MKKKLSLKSLKVVKLSDQEKSTITGGSGTCGNSGANSCNQTSVWPINCYTTMVFSC
ncbi:MULTISPECIES: hypothetical protein [unclassified Flavobacterium]|uniref:hypothetical protein n=1 Tax=unclassified Flavobacterium TaxID=196869 RepID=UPI000C42248F|nr:MULTISPECIES: hypothetical protein [unclassified Flavobacterium]MBJ2125981.1 hypothetical protein [Flavobacterium sp. IB48]PIF34374.1 hypothetical protein CLU81_5013 [Flavobacterium sp. 9]